MLIWLIWLTSCSRDADVASHNLSKAADMFELDRRVVFYNWITNQYILTVEGKCSIKDMNRQLEVTCKVWEGQFKKHFLWLSDNVTYFAEQLYTKDVSVYHYEVVFKPQAIIPDIDFRGSTTDIPKTDNKD
jgi:hypothetical protein